LTAICRVRITLLSLALLCALAVSPAFADPVQVRAAPQDGSARVVFNWPTPVYYEATVDAANVTIVFNRPIEADLGVIARSIGDYVRAGQVLGDGQSVRLELTSPDFEIVHFPAGTGVVVDIVGTPGGNAATAEAEPEAQPASQLEAVTDTAPAAEPAVQQTVASPPPVDAPAVGTRTGRHADKLRLVFDWETDVPYRLERNGGVTVMSFDALANIDTAPLTSAIPALVGQARSYADGDTTVVEMAIPASARINHFKAGTKVVADVFFPDDGAVAEPLPAATTVAAATPPTPAASALAASAPAAEEPVVETGDPIAAEQPVVEGGAEQTGIAADEQVLEQIEQGAVGAAQELEAEPLASAVDDQTGGGQAVVAEQTVVPSSDGKAVPVRIGPTDDGEPGFTLAFDWNDPVGAAVFRRGGALWLVFDRFTPIDAGRIRQTAADNLIDLVQLPHDNATILRMVTARGVNPVARREGLTWLVDFKQQALSTLAPIQAAPQLDSPVGSRVFMPVPEPGRAIVVTDPEIGDNFVVVPVIPLGYGVTSLYQYPQFRIRPSSQGAVIEPRIDNLRIRPLREGIEITSTRTLHISPVSPSELAKSGVDDDRPLSRLVNFDALRNVELEFLDERRRALEFEIANARSIEDRQKARLELARYYLALGLGAEAAGVLKIRGEEDGARDEPAQRLYTAMADFILGRYDEAVNVLDTPAVRSNDEGVFWRSISAFAGNDLSADALRGVRVTARIPEPYPEALRIPMTLWAIEGVIQLGDSVTADKMIDAVRTENLTPNEENRVKFLAARVARLNGDTEIAIGLFEQASLGPHLPTAVRARVMRTEMLLELDRLDPASAAADLEELRFTWRGGEFEFDLLRRLGTLYLRAGNFRDGLSTLRQAATYFRTHPDAPKVTETMVEAFNALFLEGIADRMSPVSAIAIYDEFKELTPPGRIGDRMIQNLADRLASVDLLDSAAELLDAQVKFRLSGTERARVGARLAVIRLLAREYEMALAALDATEEQGLAESLALQRRHLRARTLMGMGNDFDALVLIEDDESLSAEQLRTEIYWKRRDWRGASKAIRNMIQLSGIKGGQELTEQQALSVLNYAVALTLDGNERAVSRLNRDYGPAMRQTMFADAFKLIATPEQFGAIDISQVADKVEEAENFGSFLTAYKNRVNAGELSAIN